MFRKELEQRYVALAHAMLECRPFISEIQYHRMKRNRESPGYYLILQWENCISRLCHALNALDKDFNADRFLQNAGFVSTSRIH